MLRSFSVLRQPNYRRYFYGQLASMTGSWMQGTAQAWLVYHLSSSAAWLGAIAFANQVPAFLLSPLAGSLADRYDRRRTLVWTAVVGSLQAFVLAALIFSGQVQIWHIAVLAALLGLTNAFDMTNRHAFAYDMVGKDELPSAIACNSTIINLSRILGPALAGFLLPRIGEAWCFILNGLSFLAVIASLVSMTLPGATPAPKGAANPFPEFLKALQYVRRTPEIARLLWASLFLSFFGFAYSVLLPVFAKNHLGGDAATLGWLSGGTGLGAIVGALLGARPGLAKTVERRLPADMILLGFSVALLGVSRNFALSFAAVFGIGVFLMGTFPTINTAIQQRVDGALRGRVLSLYTMTFLGAAPVGSLLAGWAADHVGVGTVELVNGGIFVVAGLALICIYRDKWLKFS